MKFKVRDDLAGLGFIAAPDVTAPTGGEIARLKPARFQRQAEVLASLNHPHIAHVYGFENPPEGGHHLVMELVDGEDPSLRIARGPIPMDEALPIAQPIAEALMNKGADGVAQVARDHIEPAPKVRASAVVSSR